MASPSSAAVQKLMVMKSPANRVMGLNKYTQSEPWCGRGGLGVWPSRGRSSGVPARGLADVPPRFDTGRPCNLGQTTDILGTSVSPSVK